MSDPLAVGLVGAGPWAALVTGPVLAAGPETRLAGIWARRPEATRALAGTLGAPPLDSFDALLDRCDAVAFAIAPDAQPPLAVRAARAGKAVLLEKPIAADLEAARALVDAVGEAGVGSMVVLTARFASAVRAFLERARTFDAYGGRVTSVSGAFLGGPFASSPWRLERGALLDVGPHALDLADATFGPVVDVHSSRGPRDWVLLTLEHERDVRSQVVLSCSVADEGAGTVEVYGPGGVLRLDTHAAFDGETFATLRREFVAVARTGAAHPCDVHRGLHLQELIARAGG